MKALILAAGFGVRLREIIHGRPKHLAPVNGKPFLRHLLKLLRKKGFKKVVLSIGYLSQYIKDEFKYKKENLILYYSEANRPLGTAGSVKIAKKYFTSDFFILNGDTYLDIDYQKLLKFHKKQKALLTLVGTSKNKKGSIIKADKNKLTDFIYHPDKNIKAKFRHAGVYVASPKIFDHIPSQTKFSIEKDLLKKLLKTKAKICFYPVSKTFIDIGSPQEYQKAVSKLN